MKLFRILIFLLIFGSFFLSGFIYSNYTGNVVLEDKIISANLTRAVDGDTIDVLIGNVTERVRMLGINTPEKNQKGYEDAKAFLQGFENKSVELEMIDEDRDQYGRMLRYVFYDGRNINLEIVERGLAHIYYYDEDKYKEGMEDAERRARELEMGIWGRSGDKCGGCIVLIELNEIDPGEYVVLGNKCGFNCDLEGWRIDDETASHTRNLDIRVKAFGEERLDYEGRIWNDEGDSLYLRDEKEDLVLFYRY